MFCTLELAKGDNCIDQQKLNYSVTTVSNYCMGVYAVLSLFRRNFLERITEEFSSISSARCVQSQSDT